MRETAARICGSENGSLREPRRGRRKFSTSSAQRNPFRESSRAMHSDPQISFHAIALPFNPSRDAKIQRLCRAKVDRGPMSIELDSTRVCTDQFIRGELPDKTRRIRCMFGICFLPNQEGLELQMRI